MKTRLSILPVVFCILLTALLFSGCKGGFYGLFSIAKVKEPALPKPLNLEDQYLTSHLRFENSGIFTTDPTYRSGTSKELSHLYLYVQSFNPVFGQEQEIPLLLFETEGTASAQLTESDELLIHYPYNDNTRARFNFTVRSVALEKEKSQETATFIFGLAQPLVKAAATSAGAASAVDMASQIFEKAYASKEYNYSLKVSMNDIENGKRFQVFFIIPINHSENDSILNVYKAEMDKDFVIKTFGGKYKLSADTVNPYTKLPYILVYHTTTDHFQDKELLPGKFDPELTVLTNNNNKAVIDAKRKLADQATALLTTKQYSYESNLLGYVESFVKLKEAVARYQTNNADERNVIEAIDAYLHFKGLLKPENTDTFYASHYKERYEAVAAKSESVFRQIALANLISDYVAQFQFAGYSTLNTKEKAELKLKEIKSIITTINQLVATDATNVVYKALKSSAVYKKAVVDIAVIEAQMLNNFYYADIFAIGSETACSPTGNATRDRLKTGLNTACEICQRDVNGALTKYNAVCPNVSTTPTAIAVIELAAEAYQESQAAAYIAEQYATDTSDAERQSVLKRSERVNNSLKAYIVSPTKVNMDSVNRNIDLVYKAMKKLSLDVQPANVNQK